MNTGRKLLNRLADTFASTAANPPPIQHQSSSGPSSNNNCACSTFTRAKSHPHTICNINNNNNNNALFFHAFTSSGCSNSVDKKQFEKLFHLLDKIIVLCRHPNMNLRNSPPYLLDILPEIKRHLVLILSRGVDVAVSMGHSNSETLTVAVQPAHSTVSGGSTEGNQHGHTATITTTLHIPTNLWHMLSENEYFCVTFQTLMDKTLYARKLFKEARDRIFDENSSHRAKLTRLSLVFSHLQRDLETLFPEGEYSLDEFAITKPEAARWWRENFGTNKAIVPWHVFRGHFLRTHCPEEEPSEAVALQKTIDLTGNYYVSIFEFDVFVRLFQPWNNIIETWKALAVTHPAYMAFRTYDEVRQELAKYVTNPGPGTYVYRLSCTKLGQWAIGYIDYSGQVLQTIVQNKSLAQALLDGQRKGFYLYPKGLSPRLCPDLEALVHHLPQVRILVSQEQYDVYCKMGSTFELCKICAERDKNVRLDPCGHLLCRACLLHWQSCSEEEVVGSSVSREPLTQAQLLQQYTCPFCRSPIKSVEDVTVCPLQNPPILRQVSSPSPCTGSHSLLGDLPAPPRPPKPSSTSTNHGSRNLNVLVETGTSPRAGDGDQLTASLPRNYIQLESSSREPSSRNPQSNTSTEMDLVSFQRNVTRLLPLLANRDERVAQRLLRITRNDVAMAMEILQYFAPKPET